MCGTILTPPVTRHETPPNLPLGKDGAGESTELASFPGKKRIANNRGASPVIRSARRGDIPALTTIHAESLPEDFLVRLGTTFLKRAFFPTLLDCPRAAIYVADDAGRILGFIITRVGLGGILSDILHRQRFWFLTTCTARLARHPGLLRDCVSILAQLRARAAEPDDRTTAELFLMAVAPQARRRGVGHALIEHSAAQLQTSGIRSYRVLLHAENVAADAAYRSTGFCERKVYRFASRLWRERERNLIKS